MDIKYAILGFLSWQDCTGYDLKKLINGSAAYYWSGNNNQVYTALVKLRAEGLVTSEVHEQVRYPARRVYTITEAGIKELRAWVLSKPEPPQLRNGFLVQLAWADRLTPAELDGLMEQYESAVDLQLRMLKEQQKRGAGINPGRTGRETYIWHMIDENRIGMYEKELEWAHALRRGLPRNN